MRIVKSWGQFWEGKGAGLSVKTTFTSTKGLFLDAANREQGSNPGHWGHFARPKSRGWDTAGQLHLVRFWKLKAGGGR